MAVSIKLFLNVTIILVSLGGLKLSFKSYYLLFIYHEKSKEASFISHIQLSLKIGWSKKDAFAKLTIDLYPVLQDR